MTYEFLPQEEPGKPLVTLPPGFTESVMQRIADYERRQRRRWTTAITLTALCLVAGAFALSARRFDDRQPAGVPERQASPLTPVVNPSLAQRPAPPQNAVQQARSAVSPAGHDHPVASASAVVPPGYIVITLDGREYHCPPEVLQHMRHGDGQIQQVRDGKAVQSTEQIQPFSGGRCRAVQPEKQ